jgi:hemolysin III
VEDSQKTAVRDAHRAARASTRAAKRTTRRENNLRRLQNINEYTVGEEVANSVTHGIGALSAVAALVLLVLAALNGANGIDGAAAAAGVASDDIGLRLAAAIIFGATLILEYTNSTLYHAFPWPRVKRVFKVLDHSSIYLLIAGTYTPFTLLVLPPTDGIWMTAVIWGLAVAGVAVEAFWLFRPRWLTAALYLCMGWLIIFRITVLVELMPTTGIVLLLVGGVCYSLGIIFYVMKKVRYMHSIWHLWTLAGSLLHFLCILLYVL